MLYRSPLDPTPLKLSTGIMDYGNHNHHPGMPDYSFGCDPLRSPPPMHYQVPFQVPRQAAMPPMKFEPIVPHENDILMGRGGKNNQHIGNEKFRQLARLEAKQYSTSSKKIKSNIARGLVMKVRQMQPAGRFLKRNPVTSEWEDVGNEYAREKASQVLRDAIALLPNNSSSDDSAREDKKRPAETVTEDETPELKSEQQQDVAVNSSSAAAATPPYAKRQRLMASSGMPQAYYSSYATTSPGWQNQAPLTPTLQPPSLKRLRSNNWFERSAFFTTPNSPTTPTMTNLARNESFGPNFNLSFLASPTSLSRQGSFCPSIGNGSLPGENFLLTGSNHEKLDLDLSQIDGSGSSDEFFTDFY